MTPPVPTPGAAPPAGTPPTPPPTPVPEAFQATPDAERYVLQADALRRRQLRAALLYGSSRYWRRRHRVWPSVIAGVIIAALLAGILVVINAFNAQQSINSERNQGINSTPVNPLTPQEPQPLQQPPNQTTTP